MLHLWGTFPHSGRHSPRLLTLCPHNRKLEGGREGANIIQVRKTEVRAVPRHRAKISGDRRFLRAYRHCSDTFATPPQHSSTQDHAAREVGSWGLLDSRSLGNPFTSNTRLPLLIHRTQETEPKRNAGRPSWPSGPPTGYFFFLLLLKVFILLGESSHTV